MANKLVLILFIALLGAVTMIGEGFGERDSATKAVCSEAEKKALLRFKQDLIDPFNWLSSWVAEGEGGDDCCKWERVVCDNVTGHVSELRLRTMWLKGKINPSLLNLKHLTYLDLGNNEFWGIEIPSFLGSIVSLRFLRLTMAGIFEGAIPQQLGNLSNLHHLGIGSPSGGTLYSKNLDWLSGLSSLEHLEMRGVNLSEVSDDWLSRLSSLTELHLSGCNLRHIHSPSHMINLTSIRALELSGNTLQGPFLCNFLKNMSLLQSLDLSDNSFGSAFPDCIHTFHRLQQLNLGANGLTDLRFMANLTSLISLDLSANHFGPSIPDFLPTFHRLQQLRLGSNGLQGVISSNIANLTSLVILDMSNNSLEGKIPTFLGDLCNLENLDLGSNKFGGNISEAFESLSGCLSYKLNVLNLQNNNFSGQILDQVRDFKNLTQLYLSHNKISGSFPLSFGSLTNLEYLHISSNLLEGVVSEVHFVNLTHLYSFFAYGNALSLKVSSDWIPPFLLGNLDLADWNLGPQFPLWVKSQRASLWGLGLSNTGLVDVLPSWIWFGALDWLDLSDNRLSGEIPDFHYYTLLSTLDLSSNEFTGLLPRISIFLEQLYLSNNSISGDISSRLCSPTRNESLLNVLDLGRNLLSGEIPDCWVQWPSLEAIVLGNNNLSGQISSSMGLLQNLWLLNLRNNSFTGEIPNSLKNCSSLKHLDLGLNKLVGSVPRWIESLEALQVLILRTNKLKGHIPVELCELNKLRVLDIAANEISGTIPNCLKNSFAKKIANSTGRSRIDYSPAENVVFVENAVLVIKGKEYQYYNILNLVTSIDLSRNNLSGEIPKELASLQGLRFLNLSRNYLRGSIPDKIGNMTMLESLDLSWNRLSGKIPPSMSNLNFLNFLNLSHNNFSGEIPKGTQLQSLNSSSFLENNLLCGDPLPKRCRVDNNAAPPENAENEDDDGEYDYWFRLGVAMGFGVSFMGVVAPLVLCGFWRRAYFWFFQEFIWYKILDFFISIKYKMGICIPIHLA